MWQVAVLLRLQMERLRNPEEAGTLLVLGSTDWQRTMIEQELVRIDPSLAVVADAQEAGTAIVQVTPSSPQSPSFLSRKPLSQSASCCAKFGSRDKECSHVPRPQIRVYDHICPWAP